MFRVAQASSRGSSTVLFLHPIVSILQDGPSPKIWRDLALVGRNYVSASGRSDGLDKQPYLALYFCYSRLGKKRRTSVVRLCR